MSTTSTVMQTMLCYAMEAHIGQTRKGSDIPYIFHPVEVTKKLSDWGVTDSVVLAAAIGHDLLEDTKVTPEEIRERFGDAVLDLIQELTWKPEERANRREKFEHWNEWAGIASVPALLVKMADRFCNVRDYHRALPRKDEEQGEYAAHYALQMHAVWIAYARQQDKFDKLMTILGHQEMYHDIMWIADMVRIKLDGAWIWSDDIIEVKESLGLKRRTSHKRRLGRPPDLPAGME